MLVEEYLRNADDKDRYADYLRQVVLLFIG
jgi:hypothetical protein